MSEQELVPPPQPFPRTFYVANAMELCERLAHYFLATRASRRREV